MTYKKDQHTCSYPKGGIHFYKGSKCGTIGYDEFSKGSEAVAVWLYAVPSGSDGEEGVSLEAKVLGPVTERKPGSFNFKKLSEEDAKRITYEIEDKVRKKYPDLKEISCIYKNKKY